MESGKLYKSFDMILGKFLSIFDSGLISSCGVCEGNSDNKFLELPNVHDGIMQDKFYMLILSPTLIHLFSFRDEADKSAKRILMIFSNTVRISIGQEATSNYCNLYASSNMYTV